MNWDDEHVGLNQQSCFCGRNPVESPEFFRFMRQLLKLSSKCEDHIFIWNLVSVTRTQHQLKRTVPTESQTSTPNFRDNYTRMFIYWSKPLSYLTECGLISATKKVTGGCGRKKRWAAKKSERRKKKWVAQKKGSSREKWAAAKKWAADKISERRTKSRN